MPEKWLLWDDGLHPPQDNMDIDMLLLSHADRQHGRPLLRIYGWDRPAASVGYIQKTHIVDENKYTVVKRPTGGGVVFHDRDLTYTLVIPSGHHITTLDRVESYRVIHRAVARCLTHFGMEAILAGTAAANVDRATMSCFTTPTRYDVLCVLKSGNTAKFAGSAQRRTRDGILHQGSMLPELLPCQAEDLRPLLVSSFENEFGTAFENFVPDYIDIKSPRRGAHGDDGDRVGA